jgi:hypothetical protein
MPNGVVAPGKRVPVKSRADERINLFENTVAAGFSLQPEDGTKEKDAEQFGQFVTHHKFQFHSP